MKNIISLFFLLFAFTSFAQVGTNSNVGTNKNPTCEIQTFYKVTTEVGTTEQVWEASAINTPTAAGTSYKAAFSLTDADGYPLHPNAADSITTNTLSQTTNISNGTSDDQAMSDFWIWLESDLYLREFSGTSESVGVWISEECGGEKMVEVLDGVYTNNSPNDLGLYKKGFYRVRLYHADVTVNGLAILQGSVNGLSWGTLPAYKTKPIIEEIKGQICDDGKFYSLDKKALFDPNEYLCFDPRCQAVFNIPEPLEITFEKSLFDSCCEGGSTWLLLSKCELNGGNQCATSTNFPNVIQVANITGGTHPTGLNGGQSINGWNAFELCSETQPADDGNGHYWIQGTLASYNTYSVDVAGFPSSLSCGCDAKKVGVKDCNSDAMLAALISIQENTSGSPCNPCEFCPDSTDELQIISPIELNGVTTGIVLSNGGGTIPINHPPSTSQVLTKEECNGTFQRQSSRTGWWVTWTTPATANVATTTSDWHNVGNAQVAPNCVTDLNFTADLGEHYFLQRRTRLYFWLDYRLLVNGVAVLTRTYDSYFYKDERTTTEIEPIQYDMEHIKTVVDGRLNIPAGATVQIQARTRHRTVASQTSAYFRYIGGLRSQSIFTFTPRDIVTDVTLN